MEEHPVVLERERALRARALERREPRCQLRPAVGIRETRGRARPPRRSRPGTRSRTCSRSGTAGAREVDLLQEPVDGVADLGREQAALARPARRRRAAARACPRRARRRTGTSSARRARSRCRRGCAPRRAARGTGSSAGSSGAREHDAFRRSSRRARAGPARPAPPRPERALRLLARLVALDPEQQPRVAALELDRRRQRRVRAPRPAARAASTQPIGVSSAFSGSSAPETISRSIARVMAT